MTELADLRAELDALDRSTVEALARRQRIVEAIARLKGDPAKVRDPERVEAVLANVLQAAGVFGLSTAIAEPVWRLLVERCADHEAALLQARTGTGARGTAVAAVRTIRPTPAHDLRALTRWGRSAPETPPYEPLGNAASGPLPSDPGVP